MKTFLHIIIIVLLAVPFSVKAQEPYSAYSDIQNRFYCFENGNMVHLESLIPRDIKVGKTGLAYLDNMGIFKVYRYGIKNVINDNFTSDFGVTDNFIYYKGANSLSVIDGGEDVTLTRWCGDYAVGDSVVMFFDKVKNVLHAYYNGKTYELENNLANINFTDFVVKDNIIAYTNFAHQFKIFYHGKAEVLETQPVTAVQVGRNTVAYIDYNKQFKIWQNGELKTIDGFAPKSFQVGDYVVAYQSYDNFFKICYNGAVQSLGFFEKNYTVKDHVVAYEDGNSYFNIFYKGHITSVDNYWPVNMLVGYNSMAYINKANILRLFQFDKIDDVSNIITTLENVDLNYDVLHYRIGLNMNKFYFNGVDY